MARIWKEAFNPTKHGLLDGSDSSTIQRHRRAPTLMPHEVIFVDVCSFTFRFDSQEQIEEAVTFYEQKLPASSREPESVYSLRGYDRGESERWFERLPLFLREEPKRQKVVKALREALALSAKPH